MSISLNCFDCQIVTGGYTLASRYRLSRFALVTRARLLCFSSEWTEKKKKDRIADRSIQRSRPPRNGWYCLSIKRVHDGEQYLPRMYQRFPLWYTTRVKTVTTSSVWFDCALMVVCVAAIALRIARTGFSDRRRIPPESVVVYFSSSPSS